MTLFLPENEIKFIISYEIHEFGVVRIKHNK